MIVQTKDLPDGRLELQSHVSDVLKPGEIVYTLFYVFREGRGVQFSSVQFSNRNFEKISLAEYRGYMTRINSVEDLIKLGNEYDAQMDARK